MNATAITTLLPGRSVVLSSHAGVTVRVERSGNGATGRLVRETRNGFVVVRAWAWGSR